MTRDERWGITALDTPEERDFRSEVRSWLEAHLPDRPLRPEDSESVAALRDWERQLADSRLAAVDWPRDYGGRGGSRTLQAIFDEEHALLGGPDRINVIGLRLVGPTLMQWGTEGQRARWLPRILRCDDLWSQGFSEPDAGSDLSGVRTRASLDGDGFRLSGRKIWTTLGPWADWIFVLARTGPPEPRRSDGLSFLLVDLRSPGVTVTPIRQVNGDAGFAEVLFDDVAVPRDQLVGPLHAGWSVAMSTLAHERGAGTVSSGLLIRDLEVVVAIARDVGALHDGAVITRLGELYGEVQLYRQTARRLLRRMDAGVLPGAESSINKLLWSETRKRIHRLGLQLLGSRAELADLHRGFRREYWESRASTIYGGTSEIQKSIVADRLLGLPREGAR